MLGLIEALLELGAGGTEAYTARQERMAAEDRNRTIRWVAVATATAATATAAAVAYVLTHDEEPAEPEPTPAEPDVPVVSPTELPPVEEVSEDAWWRMWRRDGSDGQESARAEPEVFAVEGAELPVAEGDEREWWRVWRRD